MVRLSLTKGLVAIVDDCDADEVGRFKWSVSETRHRRSYAVRVEKGPDGALRRVYMHRQILAAPAGLFVDHINGETLDNRRANLRLATHSENQHNSAGQIATSKFKGVSFHRGSKKWQAHIKALDTRKYLGLFVTEEDAALAYDQAAKQLHGAFARLNFPIAKQEAA